MEFVETFLHAASYLGVVERLMALSTTDIAVLFLASKPAFIFTAVVLVLTAGNKPFGRALPGGDERLQIEK